jgi:uncharacterized membrane protein
MPSHDSRVGVSGVLKLLKNVSVLLKTVSNAAKCVGFADLRAGFLRCVGFADF